MSDLKELLQTPDFQRALDEWRASPPSLQKEKAGRVIGAVLHDLYNFGYALQAPGGDEDPIAPRALTAAEFDRLHGLPTVSGADLALLWGHVAAVEAEAEKLHTAVMDKVARETLIDELSVAGGNLFAQYSGGGARLLAETFVDQFTDTGATNFLEMRVNHEKTGPLVITMQRAYGKTPAEMLSETKTELAALKDQIAAGG